MRKLFANVQARSRVLLLGTYGLTDILLKSVVDSCKSGFNSHTLCGNK